MFDELVEIKYVDCPRCGVTKQAHHVDTHICIDCSHAESNRMTYARQHQEDWLAIAKEAGLDLWLQQPEETQFEYTIWVAYRDSYPGRKPSMSEVAKRLNTSYSVVKRVGQRWTFPARMQAWMHHMDQITIAQRRQEILDMNKAHVDMATTLNEKLKTAINAIVPEALKPGEISSLAKLATEMERKARVDTVTQEQLIRETAMDVENPEVKKTATKQADLAEVVQILLKAGALGDVTKLGIRQTTEVIAVDAAGNSSSLMSED